MAFSLQPTPNLALTFADRHSSPFTIQTIKALTDQAATNCTEDNACTRNIPSTVASGLLPSSVAYRGAMADRRLKLGPIRPFDYAQDKLRVTKTRRAGENVSHYDPLLPLLPPQTLFLHQTHSTAGLAITSQHQLQQFKNLAAEGDYLISTVPGTALAVLTADCLPVLLYAPDINAIAAVHAGWRGSVAQILPRVINELHQLHADPAQIKVWFGPAAGACCYAVSPEFAANLTTTPIITDRSTPTPVSNPLTIPYPTDNRATTASEINIPVTANSAAANLNLTPILITRSGQTYFDLARYNYELLLLNGILSHNVDLTCNLCTICHLQFGSYRREGLAAALQVSQIVLKP